MTETPALENPFIGLRAYQAKDSIIFYGRKAQTLDLLKILRDHKFLAVVGSSGSGKSSLVRAGLIPHLQAGYIVNERDQWRVAISRPGTRPLDALIKSIGKCLNYEPEKLMTEFAEEGIRTTLKIIHRLLDREDVNLLILIDQFEELFRYAASNSPQSQRRQRDDNSTEFVSLIMALSEYKNAPVYVVITMRSDFIGDCNTYPGLPELLNKSQYLVPRLDSDMIREVIKEPLAMFKHDISGEVVDLLQNQMGDDQDQLPVIQHLLMRMYNKYHNEPTLQLKHYNDAGGYEAALSEHGDEILKKLSPVQKDIAKVLFQRLTDSSRGIRRPTALKEIVEISGAKKKDVTEVVERFRAQDVSFLMPPPEIDLDDDVKIDITHESLMRNWGTLRGWSEEEAEAADNYLYYSKSARSNREGQLDELNTRKALKLFNAPHFNEAWARRYNNQFTETRNFVYKSRDYWIEDDKKKRRALRTKRSLIMIAIVFSLMAVSWIFIANARSEAIAQKEIAKAAAEKEQKAIDEAERLSEVVKLQRKADSLERIGVQDRERKRKDSTDIAQAHVREELQRKEQDALKKAYNDVQIEKQKADEAAANAVKQEEIAEGATTEAIRLQGLASARYLASRAAGYIPNPATKKCLALKAYDLFVKNTTDNTFDNEIYSGLLSATAETAKTKRTHTSAVTDLLLRGSDLISCGNDGRVFITNLNNKTKARVILPGRRSDNSAPELFKSLVLDSNADSLYAGSDERLLVYDFEKKVTSIIYQKSGADNLLHVANLGLLFSADNQLMLFAHGRVTALDTFRTGIRNIVTMENDRILIAELDKTHILDINTRNISSFESAENVNTISFFGYESIRGMTNGTLVEHNVSRSKTVKSYKHSSAVLKILITKEFVFSVSKKQVLFARKNMPDDLPVEIKAFDDDNWRSMVVSNDNSYLYVGSTAGWIYDFPTHIETMADYIRLTNEGVDCEEEAQRLIEKK